VVVIATLEAEEKTEEVLVEWRPEMLGWPRSSSARLGGFDLAVRFRSDSGYTAVAELKWCTQGG
jgi:hypothetical protein